MSTAYRLVRNAPYERYLLGRSEPFAPCYDVEQIDEARLPVRVLAIGLPADEAKALIERFLASPPSLPAAVAASR